MTLQTEATPITRRPRWPERLPRPTPSVRLRLTALYGSLFVLAGAGLVAVTNVLVRVFAPSQVRVGIPAVVALLSGARPSTRVLHGFQQVTRASKALAQAVPRGAGQNFVAPSTPTFFRNDVIHIVVSNALLQHLSDQNALLWWSIVAFGVMAIVSVALAWWLAGRALRPLRQITATANAISATNLHQRLELGGPDDELKRLAETFNRLLGRLEVAFDAQRRFVANASHELRTPLARQRAVAEVALADPDATVESLRTSYARVIAAGEEEERLIAALLLLARSDRGIEQTSPVDLNEIIRRTVASFNGEIRAKELRVETSLDASPTMGDPQLVERLVVNLLENAVAHNTQQGFVQVTTSTDLRGTRLTIENSGPPIDQDDVERLMRPFERGDGARMNHNGRIGLGLSIVETIVRAHGASIALRARDDGGLEVTVEFPHDPSESDSDASPGEGS